jgi:sphingosine kinase
MTTKRYAIVVNPRGGMRRGISVLDRVKPILNASGAVLDVHVTQHRGHATEIARSLNLHDYDGLCVIGGDGTVHEVVNGLMQRGEPITVPLGLIPAGTGNTLHQHIQCDDPLQAARKILEGKTQPLDIARVTLNDRVVYCINIIGWGAVADINATAENLRFLGSVRYTLAALWHILRAKRHRIQIVHSDQVIDDEFLFVIACNTKYTGAGMKLAPRAELGDGKVDLIMVRKATRWQMLTLFSRVFNGSHLSLGFIEYHQVRSFALHSQGNERLNLDGEMTGNAPFTVDVEEDVIRIFA